MVERYHLKHKHKVRSFVIRTSTTLKYSNSYLLWSGLLGIIIPITVNNTLLELINEMIIKII